MNENEKINVDLEIYNLIENLYQSDDEACFYFRRNKEGVQFGYTGDSDVLINSFIGVMNNYGDIYGIISAAVEFYENDSFCVIDEN